MPLPLRRGIIILMLCVLLVSVCYFYIDQPVAFWISTQHFSYSYLLKQFTFIPIYIGALIPFIYLYFIVKHFYKHVKYFDKVLFSAANSVVVTQYIKDGLKIVFGRYWPQTWIDHNPSLINNNAYGFHFFHMGSAYGSFPSGHTAIITAAMMVFILAYPKFKWIFVIPILLVITGLISMNYHFFGDVTAGAFLGGLVAYYTVRIVCAK